MTQTRLQSLIETSTNVAIGYLVAVLSQLVIFPAFGIRTTITDNLLIAGYFTIISVIRGYMVRRWFNRKRI